MEFNNKKIQNVAESALNFAKVVKNAYDSQKFYNNLQPVLDYIEKIKDVQSPVVIMHVAKGFLSYEFSFDMIYKLSDGKILQEKKFYTVDISDTDLIPSYILNEVIQTGSAQINFSFDDLKVFHAERSIKIDDFSSFDDIVNLCKKNNIASIKMIDRLFYTRVVCYDSNGTEAGYIHVASISKLPANIQSTLYPCGECTYTI